MQFFTIANGQSLESLLMLWPCQKQNNTAVKYEKYQVTPTVGKYIDQQ